MVKYVFVLGCCELLFFDLGDVGVEGGIFMMRLMEEVLGID